MLKRVKSEEGNPPTKTKLIESSHNGPANLETGIIYSIKIICNRCSRLTELHLHSTDLPEWAKDFLLSVRWDPPNAPFSELYRSADADKDKEAIMKALQLQALCEPKQWPSLKLNKTLTNTCVRDAIFETKDWKKFQEAHPEAQRGFFHDLDKKRNTDSFGKAVTQYGNLLSGRAHFVTANTVISSGQVSILENWRDDI